MRSYPRESEKYLTIRQAAEYLGVSIDTLRRWDKQGKLHSVRLDDKNRSYLRSDLESFRSSSLLSISQAAKELGVSTSTLRRWEKRGLITSTRDANNERVYTRISLEPLRQAPQEAAILLAESRYITISQAASYLGVSKDTLRRWDTTGKLASHRLDGKNRFYFTSELASFKTSLPLSISEAASFLGISESTLRRWEKENRITSNRNARGEREYSHAMLEAVRRGVAISPVPKPTYLSISQAAVYLDVSVDTLRRWDAKGILKSSRPDGKNRGYLEKDLHYYKTHAPLTIAQAATELHVSASTLRRWEAQGLLTSTRDDNNERLYSRESLEPLKEYLPATTPEVSLSEGQNISITLAAKYLGVSVDTLRRWDANGVLKPVRRIGKNRSYSTSELIRFKSTLPLSISQAAAALHISQSSLRRWEEKGIITSSRDSNSERTYSRDTIQAYINQNQAVITSKDINLYQRLSYDRIQLIIRRIYHPDRFLFSKTDRAGPFIRGLYVGVVTSLVILFFTTLSTVLTSSVSRSLTKPVPPGSLPGLTAPVVLGATTKPSAGYQIAPYVVDKLPPFLRLPITTSVRVVRLIIPENYRISLPLNFESSQPVDIETLLYSGSGIRIEQIRSSP